MNNGSGGWAQLACEELPIVRLTTGTVLRNIASGAYLCGGDYLPYDGATAISIPEDTIVNVYKESTKSAAQWFQPQSNTVRWIEFSDGKVIDDRTSVLGVYEAAVAGGYTGTKEAFYEDLAAIQGLAAELEAI